MSVSWPDRTCGTNPADSADGRIGHRGVRALGRGASGVRDPMSRSRIGVLLTGLFVDLWRNGDALCAQHRGGSLGGFDTLGWSMTGFKEATLCGQRTLPAAAGQMTRW